MRKAPVILQKPPILLLIPPKKIPRINFFGHVAEHVRVKTVGQDDVRLSLKLLRIINNLAVEKLAAISQGGLVNDNRDAHRQNSFHDVLDGGGAEVVAVALHCQTIHAYGTRVAADDLVRDEFLSDGVGFDDGFNHGLRDVFIVGEELLGILGQAITSVSERGVVVVGANSWVHTYAVDNHLRVQAFDLGIGVKLVEVADPDCEIGVGEKLDGFRFCKVRKQNGNVLRALSRALLFKPRAFQKKIGEHLPLFFLAVVTADNDPAWMQVVIKGFGLTEELRAEDNVFDTVFCPYGFGVSDGDG